MADMSVITCDLEGRIETFNEGASKVFGYAPEEVIGRKRVSLFSPGLTVLEHVPTWLALAVKNGKYESKTIFVRKDGTKFPAQIKITPTFRKGQQVGYCGVTRPLPMEAMAEAAPRVSFATRVFAWLVIMRVPFLSASLIPVLIAAAFASAIGETWSWIDFGAAFLGTALLHLAANTFNDYFDWTSGTDQENNDYFLPFSGGSRSIELGLITEDGLRVLAWALLAGATACGGWLAWERGWPILAYGVAGALGGYFYTAPPLRLIARRGVGELLIGLCFGPIITGGTYTALTGDVTWASLLVGIPTGLLTTAILWINEFPDAESDARAGKNHLVVTLGKATARWGYLALIVVAFASLVILIAAEMAPLAGAVALLTAPLAWQATTTLFREYEARTLVKGNQGTIILQATFGLLMAIGMGVSTLL
jgi:1,4-dihydroxy-2-naphthoate octaprenyltransferase